MSTEIIRWHGVAEPGRRPIRPGQRVRLHVPSSRWFWPLWSFIAVVSVLDAWLVVFNLSEMLLVEENWICWSLIRADPHGLGFFLPAKAAGTAAVLLILRGIVVRLERQGMLITSGVALYQLSLLLYFLR
jgi:hypothetical protein